jgi:hypothetical protein
VEIDPPVWDDLFMCISDLVRVTRSRAPDDETAKAIRRLVQPLEYIARRGPGRRHPHARRLTLELEELLASELKVKPAAETSPSESDD